jgi:amidase
MSVSSELASLDATAQAALVRNGDATATELVEAAIERIEALNPTLGAVVTPMYDTARAQAAAGPAGVFGGVPFLVKDLVVEVAGVPFHEGSRWLRDHVSSYDSELVVRLRRAGLVIVGKTATPEFGMMPACEPLLSGPVRNPWDLGRSTSGSSGGSAAAVAAGLVPMAHGNDLGGSIRYPASACGLFGLKPTRARNPLGPEYGDAISGWVAEHALTRTVRDSAALLDATSGPMLGDPYQAPAPWGRFLDAVGRDPGRLRVGFTALTASGEPGHPDCVAALEDAVALCAELGHEVVQASLPGLTPEVGRAIGTVFDSTASWIVEYWTRRLGRPPGEGDLEPVTRWYWEQSRSVTAGHYLTAVEETQRFTRVVATFLTEVDVWLTPTLSTPPLPLGEMASTSDDPMTALRAGGSTVAYSGVVANITGNPAMSVPLHWNEDGVPIGVHVLGRFGDEETLFSLAGQLERARPWADRHPPVSATRPEFTAGAAER